MKPASLGLIVCGPGGRMGGVLVRLTQDTPGVALAGAVDRPGSRRLGQDAGEVRARGIWASRSLTASTTHRPRETA